MTDNLKTIVSKQKEILAELENESTAIAENDLSKENDSLKKALEKLQADYSHAENNLKLLSEQNAELKNALYEQIYNEKMAILRVTEHKLNIYFKSHIEGETDRLTAFESEVKERIANMTAILNRNNIDSMDEIHLKLLDLYALLDRKVTEARIQMARTTGAFSENEKAEFEALKNEQLTEREIIDSAKKNNVEAFIGLNIINKLGILLIIIGVIAASQFAYRQMPDFVKSIMMFSLGGAMLLAGEFLNRKKANVFSLGITAGGVAVSYVAIVTSSLVLKLSLFTGSMYPALFIIILITAIAFFLSQRYNSQTIAAFALIGGYLPIFKVSGSLHLLYYAMVYFILLNLFALLISINKKWSVAALVGLFLNIAGTVYICDQISEKIFVPGNGLAPMPFDFPHMATIVYVLFAFIIYTLIPVFGTYFKKVRFSTPDIILLIVNTVFSSGYMILVFYTFNIEKRLGLLSLFFAAVYLLIGFFIQHKFKDEKAVQALFYITGFVFVILFIPFQLDRMWITLGWLLEGVALTTYGILANRRAFRTCGYIIDGLCLGSFLLLDVLMGLASEWAAELKFDLFTYKYSLLTLGSFIILAAFIYRKVINGQFQKVYKYFTTVNLWFFTIYISYKLLVDVFSNRLTAAHFSSDYLFAVLAIAFTFLIAWFAPRIKILNDIGMKIISMMMYTIGIVWLFIENANGFPYFTHLYDLNGLVTVHNPVSVKIAGAVILIAICLLSVRVLMDFMKTLVMEKVLRVELYPLIVSSYIVIILTQNLILHYDVAFSNMSFSIIYVLTALAWIVFGFIKRYKVIRLFGLGLALLSVAKLFIIDLGNLTQGYRIISYFALGISLVAISFIYQYFNKRLEMKETTIKSETP